MNGMIDGAGAVGKYIYVRHTGTQVPCTYQSTKVPKTPRPPVTRTLPLFLSSYSIVTIKSIIHTSTVRNSTGSVNVMLSDFEVPEVGVECSRTCRYHEGTSPSPSHAPIPSHPTSPTLPQATTLPRLMPSCFLPNPPCLLQPSLACG